MALTSEATDFIKFKKSTMLSRLRSSSALTVYIPPAVYSAGSTIAGEVEVDFRQLQEEKIEEVHVRIRGSAKTFVPCL